LDALDVIAYLSLRFLAEIIIKILGAEISHNQLLVDNQRHKFKY